MEQAVTYGARCDGCARVAFELRAVDNAKLCDGCAEMSARIDRRLTTTLTEDPVFCDGCGDRVEFDARIAVVARACGGGVLCAHCKPTEIKRGSA
jgi:hypothetical protein